MKVLDTLVYAPTNPLGLDVTTISPFSFVELLTTMSVCALPMLHANLVEIIVYAIFYQDQPAPDAMPSGEWHQWRC